MMGYGVLAGRYLKQQRRRSLLTVLGIVLSVALISALLTMGQALKDNILKQEIYNNGSFHFSYSEPTAGLYDKLRNHVLVDRVGVLRTGSETPLGGSFKLYVYEVNTNALDLLPIHLQSGRKPASSNEVAAEEWVVQRLPAKPKLGDSVTLNAVDGKPHPYRLVGILRNEQMSQMQRASTAYTVVSASSPAPASDSRVHDQLFVALKNGVGVSAHLDEFSKMGNPFMTNYRLLAVMGQSGDRGMNQALVVILGTLVGLVVLSTIAVIYNAFHISVLERIRQFGLLRTVGATPRQIRNLVFKEASMLAVIGIPLGMAVGWGGLWLALWLMIQGGFQILQMQDFQLTFHWWIMGLSVGVGAVAVYLAAWLPARKASRVSPVEAIKGGGSIVRETYRRVRIPSLLRVLGVEGKMASNNIRRNRSKFRITTFSIVISVMLFIVFHYFTQQAFNMTVDTTQNNKIAFQLYQSISQEVNNGKPVIKKIEDIVTPETMKRIAKLPGVDAAYGQYSIPDANAIVPNPLMNAEVSKKIDFHYPSIDWNGQKSRGVMAMLQIYDDARLAKTPPYLKSGTADPAKLTAQDGVILLQTIKSYNRNKKREILELTRYKVGDTLTLQLGGKPQDPSTSRQVKIVGILSQSPFQEYLSDSLTVIGTKQTMAKLLNSIPADRSPSRLGTAMTGVQIALKDGADSEPVRLALEQIAMDIPGGQLINMVDQQKQNRQFAVQMQIFVYGFLVIIGLIGSLNIINTVQTNLLLLRREIGLLQAVGMTMGQVRKMATSEGVWFGVIGCFWGLLLGTGISYFLYSRLNLIQVGPFAFPWVGALIACVCALGVGVLSVQGPLRRMARANLIDELREEF